MGSRIQPRPLGRRLAVLLRGVLFAREAEPRVRAYHLRSAAGSQAGLMKTFTLVVWLYVGGGRHEAM